MRAARRGREFYAQHYEEVMKLHAEGMGAAAIANKLGMSYSAVYHWTRALRKPEAGNVASFISLLQKQGPTAVVDVKEKFPKHNELFLIASRRGLPVKRLMLRKKYRDYSVWYYIVGQEHLLDERVKELMEKLGSVVKKLNTFAPRDK